MSFNPLMSLITQAVLPLCGPRPAVLEFGNQTFTVDSATLGRVIERARTAGQDVAGLEAIDALDMHARRDRAREYYRCLGAASYTAIDINDTYGSLVMDLNQDLGRAYQFTSQFELVTNSGTGEHVFDQGAIFRNMHALTRPGGLMVHVMPFVYYVNHGFYSYHPNLYHALAVANGYRLMGLGIATRSGDGIIAVDRAGPVVLTNPLLRGREVPLDTLLSEPKIPRRNWPRRWLELILHRLPGASAQQVFGLDIHRLLVSGRKILVFAVLQKATAADFVVPTQIRYT